jgi:hypothetical protein
MKTFLLDLWQDLREKRLAPVAVVLLLGLVAVPVLLAKPAENPGPSTVPTATPKKENEALAALAKVKLGEEAAVGGKGSTLGVFDPDNPFTPPKGTIRKDKPNAPAAGGEAATPAGSTGGGDTGGTGDLGGGVPTVPPTGGGGGGGGTETQFMYVVDLTFKANGRTRHIKGMQKLDMLPSDSSPLLIFMGVTAKGGDAVFLVDSTLEAAGEGRCKPSESECAFAYIGPGAEYVFSEEDGDTYTIKIDEIRKVQVNAKSAKSAKGAKARASVGPQRRFVPPFLVDLVVRDSVENSNTDSESR